MRGLGERKTELRVPNRCLIRSAFCQDFAQTLHVGMRAEDIVEFVNIRVLIGDSLHKGHIRNNRSPAACRERGNFYRGGQLAPVIGSEVTIFQISS